MLADAEKAKGKAVTAAEKLDAVRQAKKYRRMEEELSKPDEAEQAQEIVKSVGKGAFGEIYDGFKGKWKAAIEFLKKMQSGEAVDALHHHSIGDISLVWGDKKMGLSKILTKHPEVVDNLQDIIDGMEIVSESDNRIVLESDTHKAVVSKEYQGEPREKWLLTAYEKKDASGGSIDIGPEPHRGKQNGTASLQDTFADSKDMNINGKSQENPQFFDDRKFAEQPELNGNHEGMTAIEQADGTHKWVGLQRSEVTEGMSEREIALLDEFGRRMGLPIVATDIADSRFNGKYADGVVYINVNRDKDWTMRWVAGHELLHDVERLSPEAYNAYKDAVRELFGEEYFEGKVKDTMDVYAEAGQPISREQAEREVVNDFGGDLFSSRDGMKIMQGILDKAGREGKPEFVKRLMEWWDRIKELFTSSPYYADVQKAMEKAYTDAMKNANERLQAEDGRAEMSAKRKRALETAEQSQRTTIATVVSSADGTKILNNLDKIINDLKKTSSHRKTFIGDLAKSLGMIDRGKSSQYATFETKNGKVVTIRLSNHNATVSNFDSVGESDGISIVVTRKPNKGITNDGMAHIVEFFYPEIALQRAEGKPLAEITKSIKQVLYSGEFKDTTGLAEIQEVNRAELDREPLSARIESASAEVNTEPTEAQKEAGNYKKGHIKVGKFDISIEQPEGSIRRGTDADGKQWESKMNNTYGYFRGTEGVDGDHIDVFLSNNMDGWNGEKAFVVDQYNPDGTFDEHKVMLGFNDAAKAKSDYLANYEKGWENGRRIDITGVNLEDFEKWIESSKRKTKPFGEYSSVMKNAESVRMSQDSKAFNANDNQGNPINADGTLKLEKVNSIDDITDEDFSKPTRNVQLPELPKKVDDAIGADGKPIVIKRNIFEKNRNSHKDLSPKQGREILANALYNPDLYGQNQKAKRPYNWILIHNADKHSSVVLEVNHNKDNTEIVNWHYLDDRALKQKERQAIDEGGLILTLESAAGNTINDLSSTSKDTANILPEQEFSIKSSKEEDKAYLDAVKRGDMETAQRMVNDAAERAGYNANSEYQGTSAFNGAAPYGNDWFVTKEERKQAWDNDEWEGYSTLGDYIDNGVDGGNIEELTNGYSYRSADDMRREAIENLRDVIDNGKKTITMYRSVPASVKEGKFRNGDWVTPSRKYAVDNAEIHGWEDGYRIIKQEVPVDDVWFDGNDIAEFGYGRDKDYANDRDFAYKNTKNNRKLLDAVTYDDNGEVIPLSKRFNPRKADERYSIKADKKEDRTLFGMHNISIDNMRRAIKQGGLAAPSMGVVDSKKGLYSGYGEITLIPRAEKIAKRTGRNIGTFFGDAWTPTYPQVERQFDEKGSLRAYKDVEALPEAMRSLTRNAIDSFMDGRDADNLAYMFLQEKGKMPNMVITQRQYPEALHREVEDALGGSSKLYGTSEEQRKQILDIFVREKYGGDKNEYSRDIQNMMQKKENIIAKHPKSYFARDMQMDLDDMREKGYDYSALSRFVDDIARDEKNAGKVDVNATMRKAKGYIRENGLQDDFKQWEESLNDRYNVKEVIFDGFTPSGKRKYVPNTLKNAVAIMKKDGKNAATGTASFSRFAASVLKPMGKLDEIRKEKGKLNTDEEAASMFQEKWQPVYFELAEKMQPDAKGFESYGLDRIEEVALQKNPRKYAKEEYDVDLTEEDIEKLEGLVKAISTEMPTKYFETKFMRPYGLDEFEKAIVPKDTPKDVTDALEQAGIEVHTYNGKEDREQVTLEAVNNNDDILFSIKRGVADTITSDEEANKVIGRMKDNAENIPHIEISDETWKNYIHTPIGRIKMGENQKEKLFTRNRSDQYGMVVRTLESPNVVLEEMDATYDETHERASSYLFVKTFKKGDGPEFTHFENVTVSQDGLEVSISSHIIRENQLRNKLKNDRLLYKATALDTPANVSAEQPANGGSLSSATKVVETFEPKKENGEKKSVEEEISADKANGGGKRPDESIIDYAKRKAEEYSIKKSIGGNSGYVGYSKSKRAVDAENRGLRSVANMDREFAEEVSEIVSRESGKEAKVSLAEVKRIAKDMRGDEWHHTSKYGNRTQYYSAESIAERILADREPKSEELVADDKERESALERVRDMLVTDKDVKTKVVDRGRETEYTDDVFTSSNGYQIVVGKGMFDEKRTFSNTQFLNNGKVGKRELYLPEWYVDDHIDVLQKAMDEYNARLDDALGKEADAIGKLPQYSIVGTRGAENLDKAEERTLRMDKLAVASEIAGSMNIDGKQYSIKKEKIDKLRNSEPAVISGNDIERTEDVKRNKKNALDYGKGIRGTYTNADTGDKISVSAQSIKEILEHDYKDDEHLQSVAAIPQIIEKGIYIASMPNADGYKKKEISEFQYYVCGLKIGKEDYTVKAVVAVYNNGNRYYDHKLTQIEKGKLIDELDRITSPSNNQESAFTEDKDKRLISILQDNASEIGEEFSIKGGKSLDERLNSKYVRTRYNAAKEMCRGNGQALDILADTTPQTLEELIAESLSGANGVKLLWDDNGVKRGLKAHLGYGNMERRMMSGFLSPDGISPEHFAEQLEASAEHLGIEHGDTMDIFNKVLDTVAGRSKRELGDLLLNNRIDRALDVVRKQEEWNAEQEQEYLDTLLPAMREEYLAQKAELEAVKWMPEKEKAKYLADKRRERMLAEMSDAEREEVLAKQRWYEDNKYFLSDAFRRERSDEQKAAKSKLQEKYDTLKTSFDKLQKQQSERATRDAISGKEDKERIKDSTRKEEADKVREIADQMREFIEQAVPKDMQDDMTRFDFTGVLKSLETATTTKDLEKPMRTVDEIGTYLASRALNKQLGAILGKKYKSTNAKGVAVARAVDNSTRVVMDYAKQLYREMGNTGVSQQLFGLRLDRKDIMDEMKALAKSDADVSALVESVEKVMKAKQDKRKAMLTELRDEMSVETASKVGGYIDQLLDTQEKIDSTIAKGEENISKAPENAVESLKTFAQEIGEREDAGTMSEDDRAMQKSFYNLESFGFYKTSLA